VTHSEVGSVVQIDGVEYIQASKGEIGYALYGPYELFAIGSYSVAFSFLRSDDNSDADDLACIVDVVADSGNLQIARVAISSSAIGKSKSFSISLPFKLNAPKELEFRVYTLGRETIIVKVERRVRLVRETLWSKYFRQSDASKFHRFLAANSWKIAALRNFGATISNVNDSVKISCMGVNFFAHSREDLTVFDEIWMRNVYNFSSPSKTVVIDIGMNVGLASLYFARMPWVEKVYAFEPFDQPYLRAISNFEINPDLRQKIKPHKFGLSGKSETLNVLSSSIATISTSIRGLRHGDRQAIEIRDACQIFKGIIQEHEGADVSLVVKMDCEGSEFEILERLAACSMIREFRIFMIEWHKWWCSSKTSSDLVAPLVGCGFDVFNQTYALDAHAGMIFAVRST
jgi:FkbM family methyltransferase